MVNGEYPNCVNVETSFTLAAKNGQLDALRWVQEYECP